MMNCLDSFSFECVRFGGRAESAPAAGARAGAGATADGGRKLDAMANLFPLSRLSQSRVRVYARVRGWINASLDLQTPPISDLLLPRHVHAFAAALVLTRDSTRTLLSTRKERRSAHLG